VRAYERRPRPFHFSVDATSITESRKAPSIAILFRYLSADRLVTIAQIEGRMRSAGSEFGLACDTRFAARESARFSQPEQAFGLIPEAVGAAPWGTRRRSGIHA
jgi:enoyl-CoA hydratase/carnithine racemase